MSTQERLIDVVSLARATGLAEAWLKREADAGRLPCIRAGRRRMFDLREVRRVLAKLAGRKKEVVRD